MSALALDDFNRADANPIGGNWTTATGNTALAIASNAITFSDSGSDNSAWYNAVTWPDDQYSQLSCTTGPGTVQGGMGVVIRQASGALTRYRLVVNRFGTSNVEFGKEVAAAWTQIWIRTSPFSNGDALRLEVQGTTLRAYNNGVQIGADATDSSIATGNAGIIYSVLDTAASGDNWEGGDFLDPGGGTDAGDSGGTGSGMPRPVAEGWT